MNWIPDFIKQIEISIVVACSAFIATSVILFGPELDLTFIKPAPENIQWFLTLICIFSGSIVAMRLLQLLQHCPRVARRISAKLNTSLFLHPLTDKERHLLGLVALTKPNLSCDLRRLAEDELQLLEFLDSRDSLVKKGLITTALDDHFVKLTKPGRNIGHSELIGLVEKEN